MVHSDQRQTLREGECFGVSDANQQRSGKTWTRGDGDGVEIGQGYARLGQSRANHGHDGTQMLAAG